MRYEMNSEGITRHQLNETLSVTYPSV